MQLPQLAVLEQSFHVNDALTTRFGTPLLVTELALEHVRGGDALRERERKGEGGRRGEREREMGGSWGREMGGS